MAGRRHGFNRGRLARGYSSSTPGGVKKRINKPMDLSPLERYRPLIDDWSAFAAALARPLPTTIWANGLRTTPERLAAALAKGGVEAAALAWYPGAFRLPEGVRPGRSLAYVSGQYHVQEEVSLIPVALLDPQPGERLLDLCAAPGSKTVQAAVRMADRGTVVANERSRQRTGVLRRHLERLGITCAAVTVANAANLPRAAGVYDRVLADVPCSCEGTSRKNPEVLRRLRRRKPLTGGQLAILRKAVQRVRPGGRVVYSTCTYAPEENEGVVGALLRESEPGSLRLLPARVDGVVSTPGLTAWCGERWDDQLELAMRVWPHHNDTGGFFVAVIEKLAGTSKARETEPEVAESSADDIVDPGPYLALLEERFGIPHAVFEDHLVIRAGSRRLSIVRRGLCTPGVPEPAALGMPFFHVKMRHPRPTSATATRFGTHATRNLLDLEGRQLMDFVFGREIALGKAEAARLDGPGYVLGRAGGSVLGIGVCWRQDGGLVLKGMVPKAWAAQIDEPESTAATGMNAIYPRSPW